MCIGLRSCRRIGGHRRAQVTKARHRNHPNALTRQRAGECHALVVAAAAAVNSQQGNACSRLLVLDRAAARRDQRAAVRDAGAGQLDVPVEAPPDRQGSDPKDQARQASDCNRTAGCHGENS